MDYGLKDRTVVVTGAGNGIGRAIASAFAAAGAHVCVTDQDTEAASAVAGEIGALGQLAEAHELDVTDHGQIKSVFAAITADRGTIDILVNNAGIGARVPATEIDPDVWAKVVDVNLNGAFLCAREAAKVMLAQRRGAIVAVASIMGIVGGTLYPNAAYHATKGAMVNLTRALALEWAEGGVRVNAVAPAFVRTPLTEKLLSDPAMEEAIRRETPLGRLVEPEEVADAVLFLAGDAAAMITGHTLPIDGGWLAR
ncbi:MAG: SDR family oxidoreductase [Proteobacteria bacterium]|nr:SDR family oxidoreductase [Pseudomonadota bacterium]